jgi:rhodanese-related sulfurtransferase
MVVNVAPHRAHEMIQKREVTVVDVRGMSEWERGHVPGARPLSLDEIRSNPAVLPAAGVLFVCAGGVRSQTAARIASEHGVQSVYSLTGGILSWARAGLPLSMSLDLAIS